MSNNKIKKWKRIISIVIIFAMLVELMPFEPFRSIRRATELNVQAAYTYVFGEKPSDPGSSNKYYDDDDVDAEIERRSKWREKMKGKADGD